MAGRIPETIAEFNSYLNTSDDYLQAGSPTTNRARLGLSAQNGTDWSDKRTYWQGTLYPKYQDPLQSTSAVKGNVKIFMDGFRTFANPLLNIMAANPAATNDDAVVFNFKIGRHEPSHATTPIAEMVKAEITPHGGGDMLIKCTVASAESAKPAGADSLQFAYMIQPISNPNPIPIPTPGPDLPSPDSKDFLKEISTKSSFTLHLGTDNQTKILVIAFRWFNTKHPDLAGSWNAVQAVVIA